jgi:hypothetical protein
MVAAIKLLVSCVQVICQAGNREFWCKQLKSVCGASSECMIVILFLLVAASDVIAACEA